MRRGLNIDVETCPRWTSTDRTKMTLRPADLGAMPSNWIGRSEFVPPDPYLGGMIDEFRVYNRALTSAEITERKRIEAGFLEDFLRVRVPIPRARTGA